MKVLIADDDASVRRMIRRLIEGKTSLRVVGEAASGAEAMAATELLNPDVVIMDVEMPGMDGGDATRYIKENHPNIKILAFTSSDEQDARTSMYAAGASGYVLKTERDELVYELRAIS